jgi:hypothetical protein
MKLREGATLLRRLTGRGIYPYQFSGLLVSPLRRLILSPEALADRCISRLFELGLKRSRRPGRDGQSPH